MLGKRKIAAFSVVFMGLLWVVFLFGKAWLGFIRYFDPDEFYYLNWGYHFLTGSRPYFDFFFYATPLYLFVSAGAFIFGHGVIPVLVARFFSFVIFLLLGVSISFLFWQLRRSWVAIIPGVVLTVLPIPSDKFIEIRPDTLAMLLVVVGLLIQISWFRKKRGFLAFLSAGFYWLSFLVLQKTIPLLAVGLGMFVIGSLGQLLRKPKEVFIGTWFSLVAATALVWLPFLGWGWLSGDLSLVIYSIFQLPFESQKMWSVYMSMPVDFFFRPNDIYYGHFGYTISFLGNYALWLVGMLVGFMRLVWLVFQWRRTQSYAELTLTLMFLVQVIVYTFYYPVKFIQYLIPASVFVAFYTADVLRLSVAVLAKIRFGKYLSYVVVIMFGFFLYQVFVDTNETKYSATNMGTLRKMINIFSAVPQSEPIFDLNGQTLYYPYPYYGCCIPYGDFAPYLSRPLPSISDSLSQTHTRYIYEGGLPRIERLPMTDKQFIYANYSYESKVDIWMAKNW